MTNGYLATSCGHITKKGFMAQNVSFSSVKRIKKPAKKMTLKRQHGVPTKTKRADMSLKRT